MIFFQLDEASEIVNSEIHRLDHNADVAFEKINVQFQAILDGVERTRQEVLNEAKRKKDEKRKILDKQLNIIQSEKNKVDQEVKSMQNQERSGTSPRKYRTSTANWTLSAHSQSPGNIKCTQAYFRGIG